MADSLTPITSDQLSKVTTAQDTDLVTLGINGNFVSMTLANLKEVLGINTLNTKTPIYNGLGTFQLSVKIPTSGSQSLLINYGKTFASYVDGSRAEAIVDLKTPYSDPEAYAVFLSPKWDTKKHDLYYNPSTGGKIVIESLGSYSSGDRVEISYLTIGYLNP